MSQPIVHIRAGDPEYIYSWLKDLFFKLRLLRSGKVSIELIRPDDDRKPFIEIKRRG